MQCPDANTLEWESKKNKTYEVNLSKKNRSKHSARRKFTYDGTVGIGRFPDFRATISIFILA